MSAISADFLLQYPDLAKAFSTATRDRLLSTLVLLCSRSEYNRNAVAAELLVADHCWLSSQSGVDSEEDSEEDEEGEDEESDGNDTSGSNDSSGIDSEDGIERAKAFDDHSAAKAPTVFNVSSSISTRKRPRGDDNTTNKRGMKKTRNGVSERKQPRYQVCDNCEQEFDVTKNKQGDCVWHVEDAEPIVDHETFADHDKDCHGPYDQDWIREEWPEAFEYECCGKDLTSPGCQFTKHKARK